MPIALAATTGPIVLTGISPSRASNQPSQAPPGSVSTEPFCHRRSRSRAPGSPTRRSVQFIAADGTVYPDVETGRRLRPDHDGRPRPAGDGRPGIYDVRVTKGSTTITKAQAFVVTSGTSHLETNLIVPGSVGFNIPIRQTHLHRVHEYRRRGDARARCSCSTATTPRC